MLQQYESRNGKSMVKCYACNGMLYGCKVMTTEKSYKGPDWGFWNVHMKKNWE